MMPFLYSETEAAGPSAPYAVLPLPYERTVSFGHGTAKGPAAILAASQAVEQFDDECREPMEMPVHTLPAVDFSGLSDTDAMEAIRSAAEPVLKAGRFLMSFGGEHTVSGPLVRAAQSTCGCRSVLQVDAHSDLRESYTGTKLSHACVMRRIREMGILTVHVGTRSLSAAEYGYILEQDIPVFWAADLANSRDTSWVDKVINSLADPVYVTIDMDGLDPSVAPGVGTPEPGGMNWRHLTALLDGVFAKRKVVAADIVETAPVENSTVTEFAAARLATRMIFRHYRACKRSSK